MYVSMYVGGIRPADARLLPAVRHAAEGTCARRDSEIYYYYHYDCYYYY